MNITQQSAADLTFMLNGRDGKADEKISIVEYYKRQYNKVVTKPRLPCIQYGKKNYVPMEFVSIADFNSIPMVRLTPDQTAEMIKVSARPPPERKDQSEYHHR